MNECKRVSDCPSDRLAQCRGQAVQARCDALQGLLNKADQQISDLTHAAPVPPVGDVEGLMISLKDHKIGQAALLEHIESLKADRTRLTAERDGLKSSEELLRAELAWSENDCRDLMKERDGLLAEVKELNYHLRVAHGTTEMVDKQRDHWMDKYHALQSELTKALSWLGHAKPLLHSGGFNLAADDIGNYLAHQSAPAAKLDPVDGDVLPPIGSKVWIELASSGWDEQTVTGYYVWPSHGLDKNVHRVFVRVKDAEGTPNARLLADVRKSSQATPQ